MFLRPSFLYSLFFASGAAGLIYEIVWGRLFVLIFGSTTNSIVAVIAAFLGGLALGSLIFGKMSDSLSPSKLIKTYARLEFAIGILGILSLFLIPQIKNFYSLFSTGETQDFTLIFVKFLLAIIVILLPTTLMGGTLPILVKLVVSQNKSLANSVSCLYAVNTFGAVFGVLLSAFVLIELLGLRNTVLVAALINFLLAALANLLKVKEKAAVSQKISGFKSVLSTGSFLTILAFGLSGLINIAYEVLWTRVLTPTVGTFIYAFAAVLAVYLLGIALGSLLYPVYSKIVKPKNLAFGLTLLAIGFFALGSVYLTSNQITLPRNILVLSVLFPASVFMGLTFPSVVAILKSGGKSAGTIVGLSYFSNTIGSILGGFLASFFFLRYIGSTQSVLFLVIVNFLLAAIFLLREKNLSLKYASFGLALFLIIFSSWLFVSKRHSLYEGTTQWRLNWVKENGIDFVFKEDETASVFGYFNPKNNDQNLFIDGVPTTGRVGETRIMAHLPILLHQNPQDLLIICFGMGSTFRSSLSWGIKTDVVELVSSVPQAFPLFHKDSQKVLADKNGRIIVNDGRNYVFLTSKKYDIITVDPPPPFNAAGTTVLYSKEFYEDLAKKLKPGGIVSQWMWFGSREDDIAMAAKSFTEVFPYVLVFKNLNSTGGMYLEGSFEPIKLDEESFIKRAAAQKPTEDFAEIYQEFKLSSLPSLLVGDKNSLNKVIGIYPPVTDDLPKTEYFLLRHKFTKAQDLTKPENQKDFIKRISF